MHGFTKEMKFWSVAAALVIAVLMVPKAGAQSVHRTRRESNASRKARIDRTIAETYGHRWEAAGGGGYERFRSGKYQQQDNQVTFWASTLYSLNPKLGIRGDVRGAYGNAKVGNLAGSNFLPYNPKISEYNFMAGPSYRLKSKEKYSVSVFAVGGMGLGKFAGDSKGLPAANIGVWTGDYAASFSAGANFDYNFYPNLSLRVTPSYLGRRLEARCRIARGSMRVWSTGLGRYGSAGIVAGTRKADPSGMTKEIESFFRPRSAFGWY